MAPEILASKGAASSYGKPVDVYACGIMCYYFLSGEYSMNREKAESIEMLTEIVCNATVKFEGGVWANVPDSAKDLMRKMLIADPSARYTAQQCLSHTFFTEDMTQS